MNFRTLIITIHVFGTVCALNEEWDGRRLLTTRENEERTRNQRIKDLVYIIVVNLIHQLNKPVLYDTEPYNMYVLKIKHVWPILQIENLRFYI